MLRVTAESDIIGGGAGAGAALAGGDNSMVARSYSHAAALRKGAAEGMVHPAGISTGCTCFRSMPPWLTTSAPSTATYAVKRQSTWYFKEISTMCFSSGATS